MIRIIVGQLVHIVKIFSDDGAAMFLRTCPVGATTSRTQKGALVLQGGQCVFPELQRVYLHLRSSSTCWNSPATPERLALIGLEF